MSEFIDKADKVIDESYQLLHCTGGTCINDWFLWVETF